MKKICLIAEELIWQTIKSHYVLQGVQIFDGGLVAAEDLGSGTQIVREVVSVLFPHFSITTESVDAPVEGDVVGRPVPWDNRSRGTVSGWKSGGKSIRWAGTSAQSLGLVRILHQAGDLLHHSQSAVVQDLAQLHFAPVQHHVLVVVSSCRGWREFFLFIPTKQS